MYELPPTKLWREPPQPPKVMYELPAYNKTQPDVFAALDEQVQRILKKSSGDMAALEDRQKRLLEKLESLQLQMENAKKAFSGTAAALPVTTSAIKTNGECTDLPKDVVINASPDFIPFYLMRLKKLLSIKVNCHTHSSISTLSTFVSEFTKNIIKDNPPNSNITVTLIWKNVGPYTELVISSTPVVIRGDINIMKYLVAAVPCQLSYKELDSAYELDSILDYCHKLQTQKMGKDQQGIFKLLNSKLGKHNWFGESNEMSIADMVAWNVFKQLNCQSEIGQLKSWFQKCENV